jgi:hypothetical protein
MKALDSLSIAVMAFAFTIAVIWVEVVREANKHHIPIFAVGPGFLLYLFGVFVATPGFVFTFFNVIVNRVGTTGSCAAHRRSKTP